MCIRDSIAFELDDPLSAMSFTARLCREQRWTRAYAARAIFEYKRFIILGLITEHPVTPSEQVDHVWHLHLLYTRNYWHDFCRDTLGTDFHHGPTKGGQSENEKYTDWYARTLKCYSQEFSEKPPADIWPSPKKRFRHAGGWKLYNAGTHWLLPKPWFFRK